MMPTKLPEKPWEKVASDLFEYKGKTYILIVNYFARYIEILQQPLLVSSQL